MFTHLNLQCIIDISQGEQRQAIAAHVLSEKEEVRNVYFSVVFNFTSCQLKKYSYGKHILAHLEKTMPDSNRVRTFSLALFCFCVHFY